MAVHAKQSHWIISLMEKNHAFNLFIMIFTILLLAPHAIAQPGGSPPSSDRYVPENQLKMSTPMAITLVGLVSTFFMIGCFSVYARRCLDCEDDEAASALNDGNRHHRRSSTRRGLDPEVLDKFPTFVYSDVKGMKIGKGALECAVCLNEFEDDDTLRLLPKCCHVFHPDCIDVWLTSHVTCPVCRANLVPIPGEKIDINVMTRDEEPESTQLTRSPDAQSRAHEISELAIDLHIGSPEVIDLSKSNNQNRPPRSTSKSPRIDLKFPRSHSTGHSLIQPGDNHERFTLRLPEEVQKKFDKPELRRAKSNVAFTSARSPKRGYRSASVRTGRDKSNRAHYERFDNEARPEKWSLTMNPPFISRTGSVQSSKEGVSSSNLTASGSLLKSVKSPFDRLFGGTEKDEDVGERSFARLTGNSPV